VGCLRPLFQEARRKKKKRKKTKINPKTEMGLTIWGTAQGRVKPQP
jgi:hypothetical protein